MLHLALTIGDRYFYDVETDENNTITRTSCYTYGKDATGRVIKDVLWPLRVGNIETDLPPRMRQAVDQRIQHNEWERRKRMAIKRDRKWRVTVTRELTESCQVQVNSPTLYGAMDAAIHKATTDPSVKWETDEGNYHEPYIPDEEEGVVDITDEDQE